MATDTLERQKQRTHVPPPIPDLDALPPTAACTTEQVAALSGYAPITLQLWRRQNRGPRVTTIQGRPRYLVRDLREWMGLDPASAA